MLWANCAVIIIYLLTGHPRRRRRRRRRRRLATKLFRDSLGDGPSAAAASEHSLTTSARHLSLQVSSENNKHEVETTGRKILLTCGFLEVVLRKRSRIRNDVHDIRTCRNDSNRPDEYVVPLPRRSRHSSLSSWNCTRSSWTILTRDEGERRAKNSRHGEKFDLP